MQVPGQALESDLDHLAALPQGCGPSTAGSTNAMAAGGSDAGTAEAIAVQKGPGLHRLDETSLAPVRLVQAFASPEVYAMELRNARGGVSRRPGRDGFCVMGITDDDPMPCPNSRAITAKTPQAV
jgi:hypothetical protein